MREIDSGKTTKTIKALVGDYKAIKKLIEHYRRIAELTECLLGLKNNERR